MNKFLEFSKKNEMLARAIIIILSSIIGAIGFNMFLIPAKVFSAGVNGVAQIITGLLEMNMGITLNAGIFILLLNLPVFFLAWWKLGPKATIYSFFTVIAFTVMTLIVPIRQVVNDTLLNAIIGGILVGIGSAFCLKFGFTTGGFDLLSVIFSKMTGRSVGSMMFILNMFIIVAAGFIYNWSQAIYTILSIYALSVMVDKIHTSGHKLTLFIVSKQEKEVIDSLRKTIVRGVTVLNGRGGISNEQRSVLMVVVNRYELYDVEKAIYAVDETAFVNVVPTENVFGLFYTEEQQKLALAQYRNSME